MATTFVYRYLSLCVKKKVGPKSGLETGNANDTHSLELITHYMTSVSKMRLDSRRFVIKKRIENFKAI